MEKNYKYDIAISFADEDRNIALSICLALKLVAPELISYYYPERQDKMIGKKLKEELKEIYRHDSRCVIIIVSQHYINQNKKFVQAEIEAFMPRYLMEKETFLIPVVIDDTSVTKVGDELDGITWFSWDYNAEHLADQIKRILGKNIDASFTNKKESKKNKSRESSQVFEANGNNFQNDVMFGNNNTINKGNIK
ncbi:TIR domain-containing protein [Kordia periserrulae]|uniref:TIR domain-containing protein n=1 Tax=Kordia periserrulae TaxID=701523 RepID=A0A2T6BYQ7_9FLAO|nr:toll/interleukin-1 receptor domain-containing protein [Kordia periserrulae]PTX61097.1 TIR domain-containing protein [Kordia periserrulae]